MKQLGNFTLTNKALGQKSQVLQVPIELQKVTIHLSTETLLPSLRDCRWPSGRNSWKKTQWLKLGWWGCPLENGPELAVGQLNSNEKLKKENTPSLNETHTVPKLCLQSVFISGVFIVNFEHTNFTPYTSVSILTLIW